MSTNVNYSVNGNIGVITFGSEKSNALSLDMLEQMDTMIREAESEDHLKALIIRSEGERTFCAGADLDDLKAITTPKEGLRFFSAFGNLIQSMVASTKLIICRVQGKAVGGANGLLAASDVVFAGPYASVRLSEISIGIGPFVINPVLKHKIGLAKFSEMAWSPMDWKTPQWAHESGLFSREYQTTDKMDEDLSQYCKVVEQWNPSTIQENKRMMWQEFSFTKEDNHHWARKSSDLLLQVGGVQNLSA